MTPFPRILTFMRPVIFEIVGSFSNPYCKDRLKTRSPVSGVLAEIKHRLPKLTVSLGDLE